MSKGAFTHSLEPRLPLHEASRAAIEKQIEILRNDLKSSSSQTDSLTLAIASHDADQKRKDAQIAELLRRTAAAEKANSESATNHKSVITQLQEVKETAAEAIREKERKAAALVNTQKELDALRQLMAAKKSEAAQRASAEQSMTDEVSMLRRKLEDVEGARRSDVEKHAKEARHAAIEIQTLRGEQAAAISAKDEAIKEGKTHQARLSLVETDLKNGEALRSGLEAQVAEISKRLIKGNEELQDATGSLQVRSDLPRCSVFFTENFVVPGC